jgi:xanthine dehydrogenase molybdenum-binding subunit
LESHIDKLAEELGIDPLELRSKNYTTHGTMAAWEATRPSGTISDHEVKIPYSSKNAIGWNRRKSLKNASKGTLKRGIGMASFVVFQGIGLVPYIALADVEIKNDGTINLFIGVVDIGGGQQTIFSMIAAEELGVRAEDITVIWGDTRGTRYAPSCHASRCTAEMGPPVLQAAAEARQKLFEIAAPILEVNVEELESKNGKIYVKSDPSRSVFFKTICSNIDPDKPIKGSGSRAPNPDDTMFAQFGANAVELEIDVETGQVNILRVAAAYDFGRAINPKLCISQIYGGIEFGVGYALSEEGIFDPYMMPTSHDIPHIDPFIVEGEDPYFAYSAKGAGENTNTPTPAAIRNAIYNAVGIWLNDLPMTPNKIMNAIYEKKKKR